MVLYLSRLRLNPWSRAVLSGLCNAYELHRMLLQAFRVSRRAAGMLYRLESGASGLVALVQSSCEPDWLRLPPGCLDAGSGAEVKPWSPQPARGQVLRFRLRANPAFKRGSRRLAWLAPMEQRTWLERQAMGAGLGLLEVQVRPEGFVRMTRPRRPKRTMTCYSVLFDGFVEVTDPAALIATIGAGIGRGKAFGFGLLSLASPR